MSGIERDVYLYSQPKAALKDFRVKSTLDDSYKNGIFSLNVDLRNHEKAATNLTLVYELLDAQGKVTVSYTHLKSFILQPCNRNTTQAW